MSESLQQFRADCQAWNGYMPCPTQKRLNLPDCGGCDSYEAAKDTDTMPLSFYDPESLRTAESVGIVEMGGLGSIVQTTAVSRAIRTLNPNAEITWYTHSRGADLLRYVPGVRAVDVERLGSADAGLDASQKDVVLNFELCDLAKPIVRSARQVGGFALNRQGKFHGVLPYSEILQRFQIDDVYRATQTRPIIELRLESIGLSPDAAYDVHYTGINKSSVDAELQQVFRDQPEHLIGLNLGTSDKGKVRRWPAHYFADLAINLARENPESSIAILSGPDDTDVLNQTLDMLGSSYPANIGVMPGDMDIGDFIALVDRLDLLVTADTFALHAARSQDTKILALVGPVPPTELNFGTDDAVIGPKLACSPCFGRCARRVIGQCMMEIQVEEVSSTLAGMLAKGAA